MTIWREPTSFPIIHTPFRCSCTCVTGSSLGRRGQREASCRYRYLYRYRYLLSRDGVDRKGARVRARLFLALAHGGAVQVAPAGAGRYIFLHGLPSDKRMVQTKKFQDSTKGDVFCHMSTRRKQHEKIGNLSCRKRNEGYSEASTLTYRVPGVTHDLVTWCDLTPHTSCRFIFRKSHNHWNRFVETTRPVLGRRWEPTHDAQIPSRQQPPCQTNNATTIHHHPAPIQSNIRTTIFPRSYRTSLLRSHLQGQGVLRRQHEVGHPHQRVRASGEHFHGFPGALEVKRDAASAPQF